MHLLPLIDRTEDLETNSGPSTEWILKLPLSRNVVSCIIAASHTQQTESTPCARMATPHATADTADSPRLLPLRSALKDDSDRPATSGASKGGRLPLCPCSIHPMTSPQPLAYKWNIRSFPTRVVWCGKSSVPRAIPLVLPYSSGQRPPGPLLPPLCVRDKAALRSSFKQLMYIVGM